MNNKQDENKSNSRSNDRQTHRSNDLSERREFVEYMTSEPPVYMKPPKPPKQPNRNK